MVDQTYAEAKALRRPIECASVVREIALRQIDCPRYIQHDN